MLYEVITRNDVAAPIAERLWATMLGRDEESLRKIYFDAFADIALSADDVQRLYDVWSGTLVVERLPLSENDRIEIAQLLAIRMPASASDSYNFV